MAGGFQHRLMWPYKVVIQEEDVEKGREETQTPSPSPPPPPPPSLDNEQGSIAESGSYELLGRQRGDSVAAATAYADAASPSIIQEPSDSHSMATSNSTDIMGATSGIQQEGHDDDDDQQDGPSRRLSTSLVEGQDISHEAWQIPESVLATSGEMRF